MVSRSGDTRLRVAYSAREDDLRRKPEVPFWRSPGTVKRLPFEQEWLQAGPPGGSAA